MGATEDGVRIDIDLGFTPFIEHHRAPPPWTRLPVLESGPRAAPVK